MKTISIDIYPATQPDCDSSMWLELKTDGATMKVRADLDVHDLLRLSEDAIMMVRRNKGLIEPQGQDYAILNDTLIILHNLRKGLT